MPMTPIDQAELDRLGADLRDAQASASSAFRLVPPARFLAGAALARFMAAEDRRVVIVNRISAIAGRYHA